MNHQAYVFLRKFNITKCFFYNVQLSSRRFKSSDNENETPLKNEDKKEEKKDDVESKLNDLLKQLAQATPLSETSRLQLAKPKGKPKKSKEPDKPKVRKNEIVNAVQEVASVLGGDVKRTESELLSKLLNNTTDRAINSLSDVFKDIKVEKRASGEQKTRSKQVKSILEAIKGDDVQSDDRSRKGVSRPKTKTKYQLTSIDLFGSKPLGIFTNINELKEDVLNTTWDKLSKQELKLAVTHPPGNYFEQMILWTEQGKIWKFPIDNEQDLGEELNVPFDEHVFLEKHLEPWCPHRGPIRHFMELVCVGLSKNPYLSVQAKKDHIEWYKNYFEEKKELLKEVGAIPMSKEENKVLT